MEWRDAVGFCGDYQVSDTGQVRSRKTGHYRFLKIKHNDRTGYDFVTLGYNGNSVTKTVHRLVAEAFLDNPGSLPVVNHIDEDKTNNNVSNLEWCSHKHNSEWSVNRLYKPVELYTLDGIHLATFPSELAASLVLGCSKGAITNALNGSRSHVKGFLVKRGD